jgi:hypothetical protein
MAEEKKAQMMRVNVAGFGGQPQSLYASLDIKSGILVVAIARDREDDRKPGFLHVTNITSDSVRDLLVTEAHLAKAINDYFRMSSLGLLQVREKALLADPRSRIERDKIEPTGIKYRINPDATNAQVALLYACYAADRQTEVEAARRFSRDVHHVITTIM